MGELVVRSVACPVPECCDRPVNNCDFCPGHQRLVNHMRLWLDGLPRNMFNSTFDADRDTLDPPARRRV